MESFEESQMKCDLGADAVQGEDRRAAAASQKDAAYGHKHKDN